MDIFIEKLVSRRRTGKDVVIAMAMVFLTILLMMFGIPILWGLFGTLLGLEFLLAAALIYGCYKFISRQNIEFEYSLTNNELDIDKIFARRRRKRFITVDARKIDILAPIPNEQYEREKNSAAITRKYDCSSGVKNSEVYFSVFYDKDGQKCLILFEPNEKMIAGFKRYNPSKVFQA